MNVVYVDGKNKGDILLYAMSTCEWCNKIKALLNHLGVEYQYINVDLLENTEKEKIEEEVRKWNPQCNYPMLVINQKKCIVGFKENEVREALEL